MHGGRSICVGLLSPSVVWVEISCYAARFDIHLLGGVGGLRFRWSWFLGPWYLVDWFVMRI